MCVVTGDRVINGIDTGGQKTVVNAQGVSVKKFFSGNTSKRINLVPVLSATVIVDLVKARYKCVTNKFKDQKLVAITSELGSQEFLISIKNIELLSL